jgi:uncharacterized protein (DUF433 family)
MTTDNQHRIVIDPAIMAGKATIAGTRIPVELVVRLVAEGWTAAEIIAEYPPLTVEDIQAALDYSARYSSRI